MYTFMHCFLNLQHLMSGWLLEYSYKCQPVDYSHNPTALRVSTYNIKITKNKHEKNKKWENFKILCKIYISSVCCFINLS